MSNKKQTAVDLLYQRAISVLPMGAIDARLKIEETYHQAKEMEKEQNDKLRNENEKLREFAKKTINALCKVTFPTESELKEIVTEAKQLLNK